MDDYGGRRRGTNANDSHLKPNFHAYNTIGKQTKQEKYNDLE